MPAFSPQDAGTLPVLVGVATARISLAACLGARLELENAGSDTVFVRFGDVTVLATAGTSSATAPTAGSYAIGPGITKLITRPNNATHMAHISATAAQVLYVTPGEGD